jgi:hypothetical protein
MADESHLPRVSAMEDESQRLSRLNAAIEDLNLAKEVPGIAPVKALSSSVTQILAVIRVSLLLAFR